jgi:photosystem II stability/assembly factor-like uncharacterized protein
MAINHGENLSTSYEGLGYAFDKVVFQGGKPVLDSELNTAQELQEILTRKSTAHLPSGWLSYRPIYTSNDFENSFYTQDPNGAKPEVAMVNGWPVYVTNTNTPIRHVNNIVFDNAIRSGARVDGVFLEVWRSTVSPQGDTVEPLEGVAKPQPISKVSTLKGIWMYNENIGWSVGEAGTVLKTIDGGVNWISVEIPVNVIFNKVSFFDLYLGYAVGNNGVILKTLDGGETWFSLETPVSDNLNNIFIINDKNICVVGDNGTILLSVDGTNFVLSVQTSSVTDNLTTVYFYDVAVGWVAGDNGTLLMTKDGGNIWQKYNMINVALGVTITSNITSLTFFNLNDGIVVSEDSKIYRTSDSGFSWSEMSDRIWYNDSYKTISEIFPDRITKFNKITIKREFAIKFTIAVYSSSRNFFKNLIYKISPNTYPNSLVLEYTGVQDNINYLNVLDLDQYADSEALKEAINQLVSPYKLSDASLPNSDREKVRVFEATIDYEPFGKPSDFRPSYGSFSSITPAQISFSVEDKAWIAGDYGTVLFSSNSGAKWELLDLSIGSDLMDAFFIDTNIGWFCGSEGFISKYTFGSAVTQGTDLTTKSIGRIYPEGNVLSGVEEYLPENIIDPQVGVETTKRIQVQYRIRIVEGVDPYVYTEAGIGHDFVLSLGPNLNTTDAGGYTYTNMGEENGDYGLWRSRCRNTYDGYSWAIPMFFVTRRNSAAFNVDNNINGSTEFDIGAIRPDGLTFNHIVPDDIVDIRRQIDIQSYSYFLEKNLEKLLSNTLYTNMSDKDQQGLQYGSTMMMADTYTGIDDITSLVTGRVSSSAVIVTDQKILDPNIQITTAELTFGTIDVGLYHNDPSYYTAFVARDNILSNEPVSGTFEGFGTNKVIFHIDSNFAPAGGDLEGVTYVITANYLDYSRVGLSKVPQNPISVKYRSNVNDPNTTRYFNGINSRITKKILEELPENVPGYHDYSEIYSAKIIQNNLDDQTLYSIVGYEIHSDPDYQRGLNKFKGQQYRGSLVLYHYFFKTTVVTNILRIPKNINGYAVYGVQTIKNINGSIYKIGIDYQNNETIRDRDGSDTSNLIVYLDPAFTIPGDSIVEVILEAIVTEDAVGGSNPNIGIIVEATGENQEALRTSFTSNFNVASRSVSGMYTGVLFQKVIGAGTVATVDLSALPDTHGLANGTILGISSCDVRDNPLQQYAWYKPTSGIDYYSLVPITKMEGLGTSSVTITFDERKTLTAGILLIPLLVKLNTLPGLTTASTSSVFYRYVPYQSIANLPNEMTVEIMKCSDFVYITNLGTGSSDLIPGEPYAIPAEHIPVNSNEVFNDNFFSNVDDLDFSNFRIDTGFVKLPAIVSQYIGDDLTFSQPNNIGDKLGRSFYKQCSSDIISHSEDLTISTPRKVFIPFLARVRSKMLYPFLRGELILVIFNKTYRARSGNKTGYYDDTGTEYQPGYIENVDTSIALYRLVNKPLVRK